MTHFDSKLKDPVMRWLGEFGEGWVTASSPVVVLALVLFRLRDGNGVGRGRGA